MTSPVTGAPRHHPPPVSPAAVTCRTALRSNDLFPGPTPAQVHHPSRHPDPGAITPTSRPRRISAHLFEQDPPPGAAQSDTDTDTDHLDTGDNTEGADQADTEGADPDDSDADGHLSTPGIHQDGADSDAIAVAAAVTDADNPDSAADGISEADDPDPGGGETGSTDSAQDPLL